MTCYRLRVKVLNQVGERGARFNILNHTFIWKVFGKTTNTAMWENHSLFVSHRVQFNCAICLGVMRLLFILSY